MGTPNTSPLVPITPGDGKGWKALRNIDDTDITCNVTVQTEYYGKSTYDLPVKANSMIQNDCKVNSVDGGRVLYGYPAV